MNTSPGHLVPAHLTELSVTLKQAIDDTRTSPDVCIAMLRKGIEYVVECLLDCLLNQQASYYYNFIERSVRQVYTIERMAYADLPRHMIDDSAIRILLAALETASTTLHNAHMEISTQIMQQCGTITVKPSQLSPL